MSIELLDIDKNIKELNGEELVDISSIFLSESFSESFVLESQNSDNITNNLGDFLG